MGKVSSALKIGAVLSTAMIAYSAAAMAGSVRDADIRGKKICWANEATAIYGKDGSFDCSKCGHGTWSLVGDMLTEKTERGTYIWKITKSAGIFHMSMQNGIYELQGSYCK